MFLFVILLLWCGMVCGRSSRPVHSSELAYVSAGSAKYGAHTGDVVTWKQHQQQQQHVYNHRQQLMRQQTPTSAADMLMSERDYATTLQMRRSVMVKWLNKMNAIHVALHRKTISELRSVTRRMGSHGVTCHPTQVNAPRLSSSKIGCYSIYLPRRDGRLSWPRRLVTYRDSLHARRQSPVQVLTQ